MKQFEAPKLLKKDTYLVSNSNASPSAWECKETPPPSGDAKSVGSGWCNH